MNDSISAGGCMSTLPKISDLHNFKGFLTVHHSVELKFTTNLMHNFLFIQ
jgi:hypothetical protein